VGQLSDPDEHRLAQTKLLVLFTAHSSAEEAVIYPALRLIDKVNQPADHPREWMYLTELRQLQPVSPRYRSVYESLKSSLLTHRRAEEAGWLAMLQQRTQGKLQYRLGRAPQDHFSQYSKYAATSSARTSY
jgi:hypothetical protein